MGTTVSGASSQSTSEGTRAAAVGGTSSAPASGAGRLISLDIFRGMTIAGMILVNDAGDWNAVWWPLDHAKWHGWTPTDLIFPFFLFIVGVSMVLSFAARQRRGAGRGELLRHAVQRSAMIFAIGFALALWARSFNLHTVRLYGVLPRIAAVYLASSIIVLYCGRRARAAIGAALLVGYWLLMTRVPGFDLTMDGNLAGFVDRKLLYDHLWIAHRFDPEGLLSTLPAIVSTLMGVFTGEWMNRAIGRSGDRAIENSGGLHAGSGHPQVVQGMLLAGAACMTVGEFWGRWFPINKNLWTSSYVLFTGGCALGLLALCYWMAEIRGWRRWGAPFVWYGSNAITVYAASGALAIFSVRYNAGPGVTYKGWVYGHVFAPLARPEVASALYASAYVVIFLVLAWAMYRKKIFLKV